VSTSVLVNIICIAVITANVVFVLSRWSPKQLSPWLQIGVSAPFLFAVGSLGTEFYVQAPTGHALSLQILYSGLIWTVVSWWLITVQMATMQGMTWRVPNWLWRNLPLALAALTWSSSLTNSWHGQFITPIPGSRSEYGVLWYANGSLLWALILCTVLLAVYRHRQAIHAIDRAQMRLCALSAALPTVLNATYTLAPTPVQFDPTVVGLAISTSMLVFSVYRGQLHPASTVRLEEWIGNDPVPGILMDRNGRILFANKAVHTLFGSTPERTAMTNWLADQLVADGTTPTGAAIEAEPTQLWQLRRDPERWVQLERRPIRLRGSELGTALFIHEETRRVRMDAALQSVRQVESLGLIAGGVAHDFNNLLVSITGNAELAELFADTDPARVREYLARIRRAGEQGADLARQLLTYAGRGSVALGPVDLNAVLTRTIEIRRASMPSNIAVHLDLTQNPAPVAYADVAHLAQIALNLVVNAEEALTATGGVIRIASGHQELSESALKGMLGAQACTPGEFVYMVVQDDGPGMSQETLARMFDPFFSTKAVGRGLGLATTLGTIRSHHGCLEVVTSPGRGSRFTVYVPADTVSRIEVATRPVVSTRKPTGLTALLVDDNDSVRQVHLQMLELLGFRVVEPLDSLNAISEKTGSVDLAMIDLTMPGLPGMDLVKQLLAKNQRLPIIVVSGYSLPVDESMPPNVGYLQKPFTINDLSEVSERVMAAGKHLAGGAVVSSRDRLPFG
jgi:signal transduction histidine kinase/CheY-like chemotaxis protein